MKRLLASPVLATGLLLAAIFSFALQPWTYLTYRSSGGFLLIPTLVLTSLAATLLAAQGFRARPWIATATASLGFAAFSIGEAYSQSALNIMFVGPMAWWSEDVAGVIYILGFPLTLITAVLANLVSRRLA